MWADTKGMQLRRVAIEARRGWDTFMFVKEAIRDEGGKGERWDKKQ